MSKSKLQQELRKQQGFDSLEQEAYLSLLRTESLLSVRFDRLFREHGISSPQYNILRILRGHEPKGLPSLEIAAQMIAVVPDITRLIDRLEKAHHVRRERSVTDRRVVWIYLTESGQQLLARLEQPVRDAEQACLGHLSRKELSDVIRLMSKAREPAISQNGEERT